MFHSGRRLAALGRSVFGASSFSRNPALLNFDKAGRFATGKSHLCAKKRGSPKAPLCASNTCLLPIEQCLFLDSDYELGQQCHCVGW